MAPLSFSFCYFVAMRLSFGQGRSVDVKRATPRAFFIPGPLPADYDGNLQNDSERHMFKMEESSAGLQ